MSGTTRDAVVLWDPAVSPAAIPAIALSAAPSLAAVPFQPRRAIRTDIFREGSGREHVRLSQGADKVQLAVSGASLLDAPYLLTDLVIPDTVARARLAAIAAFNRLSRRGFKAGRGDAERPASPRLPLVLRALDGSLGGASQRQIAISLFGPGRVEREWRDPGSYLRDRVRRAVRRGRHIMTTGYLELLRG